MSNGKVGRPKNPELEQMFSVLSEKYPKFTRVQLCMIKNPEYGVQMAPEAVALLRDAGVPLPFKTKAHSVKQRPKRKKENKYTVRLNDAQKVRFLESLEKSGCKTVQEYLERLISENG